MTEKFENFIKKVYKNWKKSKSVINNHLDEETLACFLEKKLNDKDSEQIKAHIMHCLDCSLKLSVNLKMDGFGELNVPEGLIEKVRERISLGEQADMLEVLIKLREKMLEVIKYSGDILVGQELVPAPLLRSRNIKEFKDEVTVLKDFKEILVEARVLNKSKGDFDCIIKVRNKLHRGIAKDIRITLFAEDLELESYLADSGLVAFEHIKLGKYRLEIANDDKVLANIALEVRA